MSDKPLAIELAEHYEKMAELYPHTPQYGAAAAELRRLAAVEAWYKLLAGYMVLGLLVCNWDGECIEITTGNKVSGTKQYTFNCEFDADGLPVETPELRAKLEELR